MYPINKANENLQDHTKLDDFFTQNRVEDACRALLRALHIDMENDHNTKETAARMAKMYVKEVFAGRFEPKPQITDFPNVKNIDQVYTVGPIKIRSTCSHHFVPILGEAWIGILPHHDGRVLGLSKFKRLADWIFLRPQIQEEATEMLAEELQNTLEPRGLAVIVRAQHLCTVWRGVKDENMSMITSALRGVFKDDYKAKEEFFNLIKGQGF